MFEHGPVLATFGHLTVLVHVTLNLENVVLSVHIMVTTDNRESGLDSREGA